MYCLSPVTHESLGSYKLTWRMNLLDFSLFPRWLTLPFIVQGSLFYRGTKDREREIERERVPCPVDQGRQLYQLESSSGHHPNPVLGSGRLVLSLCVVFRQSEG
jgi:hypothetical protein